MEIFINFKQNLYFSTMKLFQITFLFFLISCGNEIIEKRPNPREAKDTVQLEEAKINDLDLGDSIRAVINHAKWQTTQQVTYDPAYVVLKYPNGDVPANKGVCTDVIIRAYRAINIDLQKLVHEDIKANPRRYGNPILDANINHRRCSTLIPFFKKHAMSLPISDLEEDYKPGDIIFWKIARGHVGLVIDEKVPNTNRYYIVHNIGIGPQKEDILFRDEIVGHFSYTPW
jgi:uncharacterized protein YijF (DUF1287 family)